MQKRNIFYRLLPYLKPYWKSFALGLGILLISIPASNFHPLVWAFIVDHVIQERKVHLLLPALALMFGIQLTGTILNALRNNLLEKVGQRMVFDLRDQVYQKLQRHSLSYFHNRATGDLVARTMSDVDALQEVAVQGVDSLIANSLSFLFVASALIYLNWMLGIVTLIPIGMVFLLTRYFNLKVKQLYRASRDQLGNVNARLQENLLAIPLIKAYVKEEDEARLFRETMKQYLKTLFRAINARSLFFPTVGFVGFFSNLVSIGFGAWLVLQGKFTLGGLVAYRGYWWPLFAPINQLAAINEMLQRAQAAGSRVFEILDEEEEVKDTPGAKPLVLKEGKVEFRNVSFAYRDKEVLHNISFVVPGGHTVALVGPSGAGKTTILQLLLRFYDPQVGDILIDDQNIREVTQHSLRKHMAVVTQETFLFNRTILDNIKYGRPDATMEEVIEASKSANAHDFIMELPNGYYTEIGERGVRLSGGQRQRIAIARALLADPRILILDEPTSSVEPESEWIIQQALERLMKGRTTFVTSHRFSIVRGADLILVFEEGQLVEQGTHEELLSLDGLYSAMYRRQMGEVVKR